MKKPKIEIVSKGKTCYVLFGIGSRIEFPNKTLAKKYTFDLKKLISDKLYLLNSIQSNIYTSYRSNYFHLEESDCRKIKRSLDNFETQFDLIFKNYMEGNSSFLFTSIDNCFAACEYSILILKEYARSYKQFALKNEMYSYLKHLEVVQKSYYTERKLINQDFNCRNKKIKVIHLKDLNNAV